LQESATSDEIVGFQTICLKEYNKLVFNKKLCRADKKTHPQKVETSQGLVYLRYKEVEILIWEGKDALY
jgi:hypothetical protein